MTLLQKLCGCSTGWMSDRHGKFDYSKPSHVVAMWFWRKWDYWTDARRWRWELAHQCRRLAARLNREQYHDCGYGVMGNEAQTIAESIRWAAIMKADVSNPDDNEWLSEVCRDIDRLAERANANWYHPTRREEKDNKG